MSGMRRYLSTIRLRSDQEILRAYGQETMVDLDDIKSQVNELLADLKREYGELRVQANLARREAADELHVIEAKMKQLEAKARELGGATAEASKDVGAAAKLLGEEIRDAFKEVAKRL